MYGSSGSGCAVGAVDAAKRSEVSRSATRLVRVLEHHAPAVHERALRRAPLRPAAECQASSKSSAVGAAALAASATPRAAPDVASRPSASPCARGADRRGQGDLRSPASRLEPLLVRDLGVQLVVARGKRRQHAVEVRPSRRTGCRCANTSRSPCADQEQVHELAVVGDERLPGRSRARRSRSARAAAGGAARRPRRWPATGSGRSSALPKLAIHGAPAQVARRRPRAASSGTSAARLPRARARARRGRAPAHTAQREAARRPARAAAPPARAA